MQGNSTSKERASWSKSQSWSVAQVKTENVWKVSGTAEMEEIMHSELSPDSFDEVTSSVLVVARI